VIGRSMTFTAQAGRGGELAALLRRVAESLRGFPGCEVYLITQEAAEPDRVGVFEVWQDEESAQAALTAAPQGGDDGGSGAPKPAEVMALLAQAPERVDLTVVGGMGLRPTAG